MLIQSDNVIKKYKNQLALDYFSVEMREGEVLGLLGPNGAGKSTFIKALVGLLPINEGEIRVFGKIQDGEDPEIKRQVSIPIEKCILSGKIEQSIRDFRAGYSKQKSTSI